MGVRLYLDEWTLTLHGVTRPPYNYVLGGLLGPNEKCTQVSFQGHNDGLPARESNRESETFRSLARCATN